jgi:cytoskeletal protein CcmA (bactofilin family)
MFEFNKKGGLDRPDEDSPREAARPAAGAPSEAASRPRSAATPGTRREGATIGPSIQIDGDLRGQEDLLIEGEVNGTIQLRNNSLTVGSQGKVKADVYANEVLVDGYVEGDLYGSERVAIRKNAQVRGNVTSPHVSLEEGAHFKGSIEMDTQAVEKALGKNRAAQPSAPTAPAATRPGAGEVSGMPKAPTPGGPARSGAAS